MVSIKEKSLFNNEQKYNQLVYTLELLVQELIFVSRLEHALTDQ